MTTGQIILLTIMAVAIFLPQIKLLFLYSKIDPDKLKTVDAITLLYGYVISWCFIILLFGLCITRQVKLNNYDANNPCPELEKLENAYKIK